MQLQGVMSGNGPAGYPDSGIACQPSMPSYAGYGGPAQQQQPQFQQAKKPHAAHQLHPVPAHPPMGQQHPRLPPPPQGLPSQQNNLSLANLELWQRVQAQAAAFAASGGQTYMPSPQQQQPGVSTPGSAPQGTIPVGAMDVAAPQQRNQPQAPMPPTVLQQIQPPSGQPVHATAAEMEKWMDFNSLDNFFSQVQMLPKAGVIGTWGDAEDGDLVSELLSNESVSDIDSVDDEQQSRSV